MHPGASKGECPKAKLGEDTQRELPGGVRNELIAYAGCGSRGPGPMVKLDRQGSQAIRESYYDTQKHRVGSFSVSTSAPPVS